MRGRNLLLLIYHGYLVRILEFVLRTKVLADAIGGIASVVAFTAFERRFTMGTVDYR